MKDLLSKIIFVFFDLLTIFLSIYIAYILRDEFYTVQQNTIPLLQYLHFYPLFIVPIFLFSYEGIYTYRYDFWHESRLVFKGIIFSAILIFAYLAMTKSIIEYSRLVIGISFAMMAFLIPLSKNISKKIIKSFQQNTYY